MKLKKIMSDPILWIETFCKIPNKEGKIVPFKLFEQQKYLMKNRERFLIVCKGRQQGLSVLAAAYSVYIASTNPNVTCLLMSYKWDSAKIIFDKLKCIYYNIPESVKIPLKSDNKHELSFTNGSKIVICTCSSTDSARGATVAFAHLSEYSLYNEYAEKQLVAIQNSLSPNSPLWIESTPNGTSNHYYELYSAAERGENLFKPFFFPWYSAKEQFANEYKEFSDVYINRHGSLPSVDELNETELSLYNRGVTIEQLVWRRLKIGNSSEQAFNSDYPSDSAIAFATTGSNVFNPELIFNRLNNIHEVKPLPLPNNLPVSLKQWYNRGLTIYELPKHNTKYYAGIDTAEGLGGNRDYSVIEIFDEECRQVAEFASNKIKPYDFAEIVNDLGTYFQKPLLVIEKANAGHVIVDKLKHDFKYTNLYKYKEYDARGQSVKRVGFVTDARSRPLMINNFCELFETNRVLINSKELLKEMQVFTFIGGKMNAPKNAHDDRILSACMSLYGLKSGVNYI